MAFLDLFQTFLDKTYALIPRKKPSLEQLRSTRLIAHRGAHDKKLGIVENTLPAFRRARDLGCWGIELDIHTTADGVVVVHHDPDLLRLWGHTASIASLSFEALRKLVPQVPSLEEVLQEFGHKLHLFIELKKPFTGMEQLKVLLHDLKPEQDYHLISLDEPTLAGCKDFPREALLLVAVHNNARAFIEAAIEKNYGGVLGHYFILHDDLLEQLRRAKKTLGLGMVDSKNSLYREVSRGVEWIFSDRVGVVSFYL